MHLATLKGPNGLRPGVKAGDAYIDLAAAAAVVPELLPLSGSVQALLDAGGTGLDLVRRTRDRVMSDPALGDRLQTARALVPAAQAKLAAPLPDPRLMIFCGANYKSHVLEMGGKLPETPVAFVKNPRSVVGPDDAIVLPPFKPNMVDWEVEFAGVIGRPCYNVSAREALDCVVGYTLFNDVSARDWVPGMVKPGVTAAEAMKGWEDNIHGKQFPTFSPMGPHLALKDEISDPANVSIWLKLNGQTKQSANTDDLVFSLVDLIVYYSKIYHLMPGDIISTGTAGGVGMGAKPPVFLKAGDVVEIGGEGIGAMKNPVTAG